MNNPTPPAEPSPQTIAKLEKRGPRYTSYPTAPVWTPEAMDAERFSAHLRRSQESGGPLGLYLHIPFCRKQCAYCGCNMVVASKHEVADAYLAALAAEMDLVIADLGRHRAVQQLHLGGGTPTFLSARQLSELCQMITDRFAIASGAELAVEVDPRITTGAQLRVLRDAGFNRLSMGVQDLTPAVQQAIGRGQTFGQTEQLYREARELGYSGISFDLVFGLPQQTLETFGESIDRVVALAPDRLALFGYAHVPWLKRHQQRIDEASLPDAEARTALFLLARQRLTSAGYVPIGMDHFAKPHDELAEAQTQGTLYRNFQGYAPAPTGDTVAFGVTAISDVQGAYAQNVRSIPEYQEQVGKGQVPIERGWPLTDADRLRRDVIREVMCNFHVDLEQCASRYQLTASGFDRDLAQLGPLVDEGLVERDGMVLTVTPLGRFVVRHVAMIFDQYLPEQSSQTQFSKTV